MSLACRFYDVFMSFIEQIFGIYLTDYKHFRKQTMSYVIKFRDFSIHIICKIAKKIVPLHAH